MAGGWDSEARNLGYGSMDVPAARARLWIAWSERGLTHLTWHPEGTDAEAALGPEHSEPSVVPEPYARTLRAYFAGRPVDPTALPVDLDGTPFRRRVWEALRRIPRGEVRSYAALAHALGSPRALRAVGRANGSNPVAIVVPCHRVIEANMRIGGYSGGLSFKRFLLELEGARIVGDRVHPRQLVLDMDN